MAKRKLPPKPTASQVCSRVDRLFGSRPMQAYWRAIPSYRKAVMAKLLPELPESFSEGISVFLPSMRGIDVVQALQNKAVGFVRYTDVVAMAERNGVPAQRTIEKADRAGRSLTAMNAKLDPEKRIRRAMYGRQLVDGVCALVPHRRGRPGRGFQWELEVCDIRTCAYPEMEGGAFVPKRFARRTIEQLSGVREAYPGLSKKNGKLAGFNWDPLAAPRAIDEGPAMTSASGKDGTAAEDKEKDEEVEVLSYDDGYYLSIVIRETGGTRRNQQAELVYCERNTAYTAQDGEEDYECSNGAMAVIVPGDVYSFGGDGEKMLPVMFSVINCINNLNLLTSIRGRIALIDRPDMIAAINATPEEFAELKKLGAIVPSGETPAPGSGIVYVAGKDAKVTPWQVVANEDLKQLYADQYSALQESVAELIVNTNPEVVSQAPATNYHISTSETGMRHTGWLGAADFAFAAIDRMLVNDMINVDDAYNLTTTEPLERPGSKEVPKGSYLGLSPDDFDYPYEITVATVQETEDQKAKRLLNSIFLRDNGIRDHMSVIAEDTVDVTARLQALLEGNIWTVVEPVLLTQFLPAVLEEFILDGAGVFIPLSRPENAAMFADPSRQQTRTPSPGPTQTFAPAPPEPSGGGGSAMAGATL